MAEGAADRLHRRVPARRFDLVRGLAAEISHERRDHIPFDEARDYLWNVDPKRSEPSGPLDLPFDEVAKPAHPDLQVKIVAAPARDKEDRRAAHSRGDRRNSPSRKTPPPTARQGK
jgi:hypothetical protein